MRSDAPVAASELEPLIVIRTGAALDSDRLRRTLRNLAAAGLAVQAAAYQTEVDGGVEIELVLHSELRVAEVALGGVVPLDAKRILAEIPQKAGQPLREDRVIRGVFSAQDLLVSEGYLGARVHLDVATDAATGTARLVYRLEPGARTTIGKIEILGPGTRELGMPAAEALRSAPGRPYRSAQVAEDRERLERFIHARGYRRGQVLPLSENRRGNEVDLVWRIDLGKRIDLEVVEGDQRELEKRGLLPLQGEEAYDEALILQAVAEIRRFYQERGHYRIDVSHEEVEEAERIVVRLLVRPGAKYRLTDLEFAGQPFSFSEDRLARLLATTRRKLLSIGSGRLVDELLAEDLSNLRSFYALEGFYRARVGPAVVSEDGDQLKVVIPIVEGPRRRIASVGVVGTEPIDAAELLGELPIGDGSPYHPLNLDIGAEKLRTLLDKRGFESAIVVAEVEWDAAGEAAQLTYRVLPGERSTVEAIVVRGNSRTDSRLVRRFLGIEPGAPISLSAQLEAQRNLYALGAFSRVDVSAPLYEGEFAAHEVVVEVEEGRTRAVLVGAGYDSDKGARGLLRLSESNLLGRLTTVQFDALVAQNEQDYRLLLRQPYFARWPLELRTLAYHEQEERTSFDVRRRGIGFGLARSFAELRVGLFANYRLVEENLEQPDPTIPRENQEARVASLTANLLYDRRDDPIDPARGWSASFDAERATPFLQADADFLKLFGQVTALLPLGAGGRLGTLATSLRGGILFPETPFDSAPGDDPIDLVPVSELFFAGGRTTHRAFRRDELGIPGETLIFTESRPLPLGGGALALINLDWRVPIAGGFGGVLFVDGGNVWRRREDFAAGDARWGAGIGVRYSSPLGPLRLEIGWKLDREPLEDPYVISISLGNAF